MLSRVGHPKKLLADVEARRRPPSPPARFHTNCWQIHALNPPAHGQHIIGAAPRQAALEGAVSEPDREWLMRLCPPEPQEDWAKILKLLDVEQGYLKQVQHCLARPLVLGRLASSPARQLVRVLDGAWPGGILDRLIAIPSALARPATVNRID
jgi:hypothetical protein